MSNLQFPPFGSPFTFTCQSFCSRFSIRPFSRIWDETRRVWILRPQESRSSQVISNFWSFVWSVSSFLPQSVSGIKSHATWSSHLSCCWTVSLWCSFIRICTVHCPKFNSFSPSHSLLEQDSTFSSKSQVWASCIPLRPFNCVFLWYRTKFRTISHSQLSNSHGWPCRSSATCSSGSTTRTGRIWIARCNLWCNIGRSRSIRSS